MPTRSSLPLPVVIAIAEAVLTAAETPEAQPAVAASEESGGIAGVYMGTKGRYMADLNRPVGSGRWTSSLHFYLLSAGGRRYRTFDPPADPVHFDFGSAARSDPENSGRFTVDGDLLRIVIGNGPRAERITTPVPDRAGSRSPKPSTSNSNRTRTCVTH